MIRDYLTGVPYCYTSGSPHNEGDGITMALAVGADLWHMNNYAGPSMALKVPEYPTTFSMQALHYSKEIEGGVIVVGPDGKRFCNEKYKTRHGKVPAHGTWKALTTPCPMHLIFDQSHMSAGPIYDGHPSHGWTQIVVQYDWSEDNNAELEKGWITKGDTIPDLAIKIGLDPSALDSTIARWNADAASGEDTEFGRTLMLKPLSTKGPYYAVELSPSMLNTQGGPRRNEKAEIVKPDGTPIPRLWCGRARLDLQYLYQGMEYRRVSRLWPDCGARRLHFRLGQDEVDRQRIVRIEPVRALLVHIPFREGGPGASIVSRLNNPQLSCASRTIRPIRLPVSLIKLKRVNDRRGPPTPASEQSHLRPPSRRLVPNREDRMHRVPNQGGTLGAPIVQSGIDIQCLAITFAPVRRINNAREYPRASHQSRLTAPAKDV